MEIISKDKPKGLAYSKNKKLKKAKRLEEEKKFKRLTENKRKNAESRKERAIEKENTDKISEVIILDYNKGILLIQREGKAEKRVLLFDKKIITKGNIEREIKNFEVKLYGENWKISILKGFQEKKDELVWKLSEEM